MKKLVFILLIGLSVSTIAMESKPYAGQQTRSIKALSSSEMDGLKNGKGMGLAKAAELNHYPGPRHVLDEASKLSLTKKQLLQTKDLFRVMQKEAIAVGEKIIASEKSLDEMFASGNISATELKNKLNEIGQYRAELRFVHLKTHLTQKDILTSRQIKHYDMLRGYNDPSSKNKSHHEHH